MASNGAILPGDVSITGRGDGKKQVASKSGKIASSGDRDAMTGRVLARYGHRRTA